MKKVLSPWAGRTVWKDLHPLRQEGVTSSDNGTYFMTYVGIRYSESAVPRARSGGRSAARRLITGMVVAASLVSGCDEEPPPRQPPPPPPKPTTCDAKLQANDPTNVALMPPKTGAFCLDPTGSDRGYGEGSKNKLKDGCWSMFNGGCDVYLRHGVTRLVKVRYVDGSGSGATIDVDLSQYGSSAMAYAMYTMRMVGDGDPIHPDTPKPIDGGGAAALGIGAATLWRGRHLAEITYSDPTGSAAQIKQRATKLLPPLVKELGAKLAGKVQLPPAAGALPEDKRLPQGLRFVTADLLGVTGTGAGAFGYYQDGTKRWRLLSIVKDDEEQAKDVLKTFTKVQGAAKEKGIGEGATRIMAQRPGGAQTEWLIARSDGWLVGVGDEERVLEDGMSADEHRGKTLSQDEKRALLKAILAASKGNGK